MGWASTLVSYLPWGLSGLVAFWLPCSHVSVTTTLNCDVKAWKPNRDPSTFPQSHSYISLVLCEQDALCPATTKLFKQEFHLQREKRIPASTGNLFLGSQANNVNTCDRSLPCSILIVKAFNKWKNIEYFIHFIPTEKSLSFISVHFERTLLLVCHTLTAINDCSDYHITFTANLTALNRALPPH